MVKFFLKSVLQIGLVETLIVHTSLLEAYLLQILYLQADFQAPLRWHNRLVFGFETSREDPRTKAEDLSSDHMPGID